jgi:bile acid:Na+ symporter, BASS family
MELTQKVLPIALGIVMLGLGLSLTAADFKRVVVYPKAVAIGLVCQMLILPVVAFGLATIFGLAPEFAVGVMLLAASPGGATANLFSHLAKGDVALNITLTAVNSVLSLITLPLIVNFAIKHFMGTDTTIGMQPSKVIQVVAIVLVPVLIGMAIRKAKPTLADALDKPVRIFSLVVLILVILGAILSNTDKLGVAFVSVGLVALLFNLSSMAIGYFVPRMLRVEPRQAVAIGMEIGIHNGTLAIFIAGTVFVSNELPPAAFPAAVYSIIMFFTAAAFGVFSAKRVTTT